LTEHIVDDGSKRGVSSALLEQVGERPVMYGQVEHRVGVAREEAAAVFRRLDPKDKYWGRTPLWWAAENGHEAVVKLLL